MRNLNHTLLSLTLTFIFSIPALTAQDSLIIYARENGLAVGGIGAVNPGGRATGG